MSETAVDFPELELIDTLIAGLEGLIAEADETPLSISVAGAPKRAVYRILGAGLATDRKPKAADAVHLDEKRLILHCAKTEVVRQTPLEVAVQAEKSGRGEVMAVITGKVTGLKRVRGGYDVEIDIGEMRKTRITPAQKLRECLGKGDVPAWNRWCQDIRDSLELIGMDLRRADLSGCDLCCADLTDADLSGANLTGTTLAGADLTRCKLDQVTVSGTDFFRARMVRSQSALLPLSGMPESESVVFED